MAMQALVWEFEGGSAFAQLFVAVEVLNTDIRADG